MISMIKKDIEKIFVICSTNTADVFIDQVFESVKSINLQLEVNTVVKSHKKLPCRENRIVFMNELLLLSCFVQGSACLLIIKKSVLYS